MTPIKARIAHLMTRRIAVAASIVTLAGAAAGAAALAAVHAFGPAPAAGQLTASTAPQTPSSAAAGAKDGHHHRPVLALAVVRATARETGLSLKTIRQELRSGRTIDQIAGSKASAVEDDVLAALQARLDKAVDAGKMTKDQEARRLATAKARIETLMSTPIGAHRGKPSTSG